MPSPGPDDSGAPTTVPTAPTPVVDTVLGDSSAGASSTPGLRTDEPSANPTSSGTGGSSTTGGVDPQLPRSAPPVPAEDTMLVASRTVELTGEGTPGSRVEVRSGTLTAATTAGSDGTWRTTLRFSGDGVERVGITATTPDHATSVPVVVTVTVDTTAPAAPTIATTWTPTDTTPPVFSGTAEAGSTVDVTVVRGTSGTSGTGGTSSTATASTTTGADGHWRVAVDGLTPTATGIRATARDAAGNTSAATSSAPFAFVPTITDPADGSTATSGPLPVTITGWADTDVEVAVDGALVGT
ncbi:Ig-like domain-containing protein, partial [Curtobacterium sp. CT11-45]|uniref:Ig-like domain-containing protein n=1 Tax=Curtobacterium sp. CT11-45 TaxID=3243037 RepID=UPI0039AFA211